jgi:RNase P subunit RPR2
MVQGFNKDAVECADRTGHTVGLDTYITCPYCGWEDRDTWECGMIDEDIKEVQCGNCEKTFSVSCTVSRTFRSDRLSEKEVKTCEHLIAAMVVGAVKEDEIRSGPEKLNSCC